MSNTVKQLGFIPTNRGEFDTTGQTRYYKDNVVQYRNGSYICSPVGYSSSNPTAYTTNAPYQDGDTELNPNWKLMASVGLVDAEPTAGSDNLIKSGGVQNELALGAVYDVSAKNPTAGPNNNGKFESLSALLSDANLNTLIPTVVRKGGMSIKFVQSSDNKYVQYFLKKNTWSTTVSNWEKMNLEEEVSQLSKEVDGNVLYNIDTWQPSTAYKVGDVRNYNGLIYQCKTNHTSSTTFISTYWDRKPLYSLITENTIGIIDLQRLNGKKSYTNSVTVKESGKYRNASGRIVSLSSCSISNPIHLLPGMSVYFEARSNAATISALSLVKSDSTYISTLYLGNAGVIQYIAPKECYVEVCDIISSFNDGVIYVISSEEMSTIFTTMAKKTELSQLGEGVVENKSLILKSKILEHLTNPFVKTQIHLFGDSITQGQGSSDFSATGESIPNFPTVHRNVGHKSYAALFEARVKDLYNRLVWTSISSEERISKITGIVTLEGDYQTNNLNGVTLIQFTFSGTGFSVVTLGYTYGGIFNVVVDDEEIQSVDTYGNGTYITTVISGLADTEHTVRFVGTSTKSHSSSINVIRFSSIGLTKVVEVINDGIIGHQSRATNGVVSLNATASDNFIIWMSGTNDRINGYYETEGSVSGLLRILKTKNLSSEVIVMAASPCGQGEFTNPIYVSHMQDINAAICKMARKYNLCFISHYEFLTRYCREQGGSISLICSDGVHPNDLGHMLIYQNMCKELNLSADSNF